MFCHRKYRRQQRARWKRNADKSHAGRHKRVHALFELLTMGREQVHNFANASRDESAIVG